MITRDATGHGAFVDAWLARVPAGLDAATRLDAFEHALDALWNSARTTLGEVTLAAIAERVVCAAVERFPALVGLTLAPAGLRVDGLRARVDALASDDVAAWTRFVLTELLTVLGNLTADVLTPSLHAALDALAPTATRARASQPSSPADSTTEPKP